MVQKNIPLPKKLELVTHVFSSIIDFSQYFYLDILSFLLND